MLRIVSALIIIGSLSIAIPSILYWIMKAMFNIDFGDTTTMVFTLFIFGMVIWILLSTSTTQDRGHQKLQNWFDRRLGGLELRTRYLLRLSLLRMGWITFVGTALFGVFSGLAGEKQTMFIDLFIFGLFLMWFSTYLISDEGVALVHFRKFRNDKVKSSGDLRRALKCYNKSVDFRFSSKKLSASVQYAMHVYDLDLEECKNNIAMRLNEIIQSLENKQYGQIPEILVQLSSDYDSFLKNYGGLGIEIKPSLWVRTKENISSSLLQILPKLFWFLTLIAIYLILRTFIPIELSFL